MKESGNPPDDYRHNGYLDDVNRRDRAKVVQPKPAPRQTRPPKHPEPDRLRGGRHPADHR